VAHEPDRAVTREDVECVRAREERGRRPLRLPFPALDALRVRPGRLAAEDAELERWPARCVVRELVARTLAVDQPDLLGIAFGRRKRVPLERFADPVDGWAAHRPQLAELRLRHLRRAASELFEDPRRRRRQRRTLRLHGAERRHRLPDQRGFAEQDHHPLAQVDLDAAGGLEDRRGDAGVAEQAAGGPPPGSDFELAGRPVRERPVLKLEGRRAAAFRARRRLAGSVDEIRQLDTSGVRDQRQALERSPSQYAGGAPARRSSGSSIAASSVPPQAAAPSSTTMAARKRFTGLLLPLCGDSSLD
jgi:hypothetical protein